MRLRALLVAVVALAGGPAALAADASCPALAAWDGFTQPLPHAQTDIQAAKHLKIVAIGSSSTFGTGASTPSMSYPRQLERLLTTALPGVSVQVLNKGVPGELAVETVKRFGHDVAAEHPDLVIWQVGTNEVVEKTRIGHFRAYVDSGIDQLKRTGADVVVMDPQYSPMVLQRRDHDAVVADVDGAARDSGINLLPRFALMRHWVTAGRFSLVTIASIDGLHMNDASYSCLAGALDDALVEALTVHTHLAQKAP